LNARTRKPGEVRSLIEDLRSPDDVRRQAAVARLAIIGSDAVEPLIAAYTVADRELRIGILRALERIGDPRAGKLARAAVAEGGDVALGAIAILQGLLDAPRASASTPAFDALMTTALDRSLERRIRVGAFTAMRGLPAGVRDRVAEALASPDDGAGAAATSDAEALWRDAADGHLPDDPAALREVVGMKAPATALSTVLRVIEVVRARESGVRSAKRRAEWRAVRGALHQVLAARGSRVALHDLRETLADGTAPMPASFLAAAQAIGDASCVDALAAAYDRAADPAARQQVVAAFKGIVKRERLTKRHAALKRIASSALGLKE
jgi:hypothetical protein